MFLNTARYGKDINAYDIVKFLAISLMVIDHIGFFLLPDDVMLRAIGRICVPMWFFLAGYSRAGWKDPLIIGGMAVLVAADIYFKSPVFPLNVLATILIIRIIHTRFLDRYLENVDAVKIITMVIVIILWDFMAAFLWEYGSLAFLFSICGTLVRQGRKDRLAQVWFVLAGLIFCMMETIAFAFTFAQATVMVAGVFTTLFLLYSFRVNACTIKGGNIPAIVFLFIARNSLAIYVLHWLVLLHFYHQLYPEHYTQFIWVRISQSMP